MDARALIPGVLTLIAITDDLRDGLDGLVARAVYAARGGATMLQLRLKDVDARTLATAARALIAALPPGVPLIINDRADVALACDAAGVHVGSDDVSAAALRRIVPAGFVIGASMGSDDEILNAVAADYVGIGPVNASPSKLDAGTAIGVAGFARLTGLVACPAVAVGGVTAESVPAVIAAGAAGVATIGSIFGSRDPEAAARSLRAAIDGARRSRPEGSAHPPTPNR
jgi:thiamine-phosphate pyrophosphorylase